MKQGKPNQNEQQPGDITCNAGERNRKTKKGEKRQGKQMEDKRGQDKRRESGKEYPGHLGKEISPKQEEIQTCLRLLQGNIQNRKTM